jgi:hypothetical protein
MPARLFYSELGSRQARATRLAEARKALTEIAGGPEDFAEMVKDLAGGHNLTADALCSYWRDNLADRMAMNREGLKLKRLLLSMLKQTANQKHSEGVQI